MNIFHQAKDEPLDDTEKEELEKLRSELLVQRPGHEGTS